MSGLLDGLRSFYFSLEDRYYSVLDKIQKAVPVYSIVDPIDKIIPSFILVIALLLLGVVGIALALSGGVPDLFPKQTVALTLTFADADNAPLSGVVVSLTSLGDVPDSFDKVTDEDGIAVFELPPGDYTVDATADGFEDFAQDITVNAPKEMAFQLSAKAPPVKSRSLVIVDEDGAVFGSLFPVTLSLSFACQSGSPPADQTVFKGNITVLQPSSCIGLAVTISTSGYVTKSQPILGDTTTIQLEPDDVVVVPPTPTKGSVEVVVKDKDGKVVPGVQVKLYKNSAGTSDVLASQTLTDTGGFALLDDVLPGKYKLTATKQGYKIYTSAEFQVNAGEKNTINVSPLALASTSKKFLVKVLSSEDQHPISGATVILFLQGSGGKYLEDGTYTTDVVRMAFLGKPA
ncbi:MAG: carboxypeptidase regulatory-like domain-containing protein, partial [archaeon]